jgi:alanine dehydrogenase
MITITEQQVRDHLPMARAIALLDEAFAEWRLGRAQNHPRRRLVLPTGAVLHSLAGACGRYFGTKVYSTHGQHGAWFHVLLYDAGTARPLAFIEANWLGQIRTGAASGHATALLAPAEAAVVGLIGTGFQAASQIEAMRCVRPIQEVRVWSRSAEKRERFAREHQATAVATAEEAVRGADIVITATFAKEPVLDAAWLSSHAHINAMGSNQAQKRELPREAVERCALIVVDSVEQAKIESGDLIANGFDWSDPRLKEMKDMTGPSPQGGMTLFKSNGLGLEDVAVAAFVYEQILQRK